MEKIMQMLSKMDKKDLEIGLAKASQFLQAKDKNDVLDEFQKKMK